MLERSRNPLTYIFVFFILLFVYSRFGPNLPISIVTQEKGQPLVVEGTGKVSVAPDIAKVSLGIEENGTSLKNVQDSVNKKSKTLTDEFKKLGIKEEDIKTTSYNLYPEYNYDGSTPRITGYRVSTNYEVKITNFDKVNDVLASATGAGANIIGNVSFEVNKETRNKKLQEARQVAVDMARQKAEGLAKATGIHLGKIINISEQEGIDYGRPIALMDKAGTGGAAPISQPEIAPGQTELSITVFLSFETR